MPRPSAEFAVSQLPFSLGSPEVDSSDTAPIQREGTEDEQPGQAAAEKQTDRQTDAPPPGGAGQQPGGQADRQGAGTAESGQPSADGQGASQQAGQQDSADGQSSGGSSQGKSHGKTDGKADGSSGAKSGEQSRQSSGDSPAGERQPGKQASQDPSPPSRQSKTSPAGQPKVSPPGQPPQNKDDKPSGDSQFVQAVKRYRRQQQEIEEQYGDKQPPESPEDESPEEEPEERQNSINAPDVTPALSPLLMVLKWAFYAAFALAVLYALWRFRHEVLAAIRAFLAELRDWWASLWGGRRDVGLAKDEVVDIRVPPSPFASFADPFASGAAGRLSPEELVRYSFEAFEAWSREHGCPRGPEQTPHELARDVARLNAFIAADARHLADAYSRAAYGRARLDDNAREAMRQLWRQMTRQPLTTAR